MKSVSEYTCGVIHTYHCYARQRYACKQDLLHLCMGCMLSILVLAGLFGSIGLF